MLPVLFILVFVRDLASGDLTGFASTVINLKTSELLVLLNLFVLVTLLALTARLFFAELKKDLVVDEGLNKSLFKDFSITLDL